MNGPTGMALWVFCGLDISLFFFFKAKQRERDNLAGLGYQIDRAKEKAGGIPSSESIKKLSLFGGVLQDESPSISMTSCSYVAPSRNHHLAWSIPPRPFLSVEDCVGLNTIWFIIVVKQLPTSLACPLSSSFPVFLLSQDCCNQQPTALIASLEDVFFWGGGGGL